MRDNLTMKYFKFSYLVHVARIRGKVVTIKVVIFNGVMSLSWNITLSDCMISLQVRVFIKKDLHKILIFCQNVS